MTLQLTVESSGTYHLQNQMVRTIPFGKLHKTWPVIEGDEIFLLSLGSIHFLEGGVGRRNSGEGH